MRPPAAWQREPWVMRMRWDDLLFAHWTVPADALRAHLPPDLELDAYEDRAYIGIVPFRMADVAPRGLPAPPRLGTFPEVNVRTYVRHRGRPGVWFLSLDAASRLAVEGARMAFHLPYFAARMTVTADPDGTIDYRSDRTDRRAVPSRLHVRYRPTGPVALAAPGSLDAWLTHRMRLFAVDPAGRIERTEIAHAPWPLQPAEATFEVETLTAGHGITLDAGPPHLRFARSLDVRAWWPRPA